MRNSFNTTAAQEAYYQKCSFCRTTYYTSLIRECPEQEGRTVCAYCCRVCRQHYQAGTMQGCRKADEERQSKKKRGAA